MVCRSNIFRRPNPGYALGMALWCPVGKLFSLVALFWAVGTLASTWTSRAGDYSKARRALEIHD